MGAMETGVRPCHPCSPVVVVASGILLLLLKLDLGLGAPVLRVAASASGSSGEPVLSVTVTRPRAAAPRPVPTVPVVSYARAPPSPPGPAEAREAHAAAPPPPPGSPPPAPAAGAAASGGGCASSGCGPRGTCNLATGACECAMNAGGEWCETSGPLAECFAPYAKLGEPPLPSEAVMTCDCRRAAVEFWKRPSLDPNGRPALGSPYAVEGACLETSDLREALKDPDKVHQRMMTDAGEIRDFVDDNDRDYRGLLLLPPSECRAPGGCGNGVCSTVFSASRRDARLQNKKQPLCFCAPGAEGPACERATGKNYGACLNGCSGNGRCIMGLCACDAPSFGMDCSLRSAPPATTTHAERHRLASVSPKIYVPELPARYTQYQYAGGWWARQDTGRLIGMKFIESVLHSPHRTLDAEAADLVLIPVAGGARVDRASAWEALDESLRGGKAPLVWAPMGNDAGAPGYRDLRPAFERLEKKQEDVIPEFWKKAVLLTHNGIHAGKRRFGYVGGHQTGKDVVVPPAAPEVPKLRCAAPRAAKSDKGANLLFFSGTLVHDPNGSHNLREELFDALKGEPDVFLWDLAKGAKPRQETEKRSIFCYGPPGKGGGWGNRAYIAMLNNCIPVVPMYENALALEELLDWSKFAVLVPEGELKDLPKRLRAIGPEQLASMRKELFCACHRMQWRWNVNPDDRELDLPDALESTLQLLWRRAHGGGQLDSACDTGRDQ